MTDFVDWSRQPLGMVPDLKIALAVGVSESRVCRARNDLDIPPYNVMRGIVWDRFPLGDVHDSELAPRIGVSEAAVRAARKFYGITDNWRRNAALEVA